MLNRTRTEGEVTRIEIVRRSGLVLHTVIDSADLPALIMFGRTWHAKWCKKGGRYYVATEVARSDFYLHRFLMGDPSGLVIDHINRDSLDNRRGNLRAVTYSENHANSPSRLARRERGVGATYRPKMKRWQAQMCINGTTRYVGLFLTREEAIAAVEAKRLEMTPGQ